MGALSKVQYWEHAKTGMIKILKAFHKIMKSGRINKVIKKFT